MHRPRYDDWSFPKGKLDPGESFADAARREVLEETGLVGELGPALPESRYVDHRGRSKVVRWWLLEVAGPTDSGLTDPGPAGPARAASPAGAVGGAPTGAVAGEGAGGAVPNDEVDELRWIDPAGAAALVTHAADAELARLAGRLLAAP